MTTAFDFKAEVENVAMTHTHTFWKSIERDDTHGRCRASLTQKSLKIPKLPNVMDRTKNVDNYAGHLPEGEEELICPYGRRARRQVGSYRDLATRNHRWQVLCGSSDDKGPKCLLHGLNYFAVRFVVGTDEESYGLLFEHVGSSQVLASHQMRFPIITGSETSLSTRF